MRVPVVDLAINDVVVQHVSEKTNVSSTSSKTTSRVAQFISRRIDELRPRRSQLEIGIAAGFKAQNMISMVKTGDVKLPMDRVAALAKALECDPAVLARLALEQFFDEPVLEMILGLAETHRASRELDVVATWSIAVGAEVRAAVKDVKFAKQFAASAVSRAQGAEESLRQIRAQVDAMAIAARTPGALLR